MVPPLPNSAHGEQLISAEPRGTARLGWMAPLRHLGARVLVGSSSSTRVSSLGDAPDFVEVGEAGIAMDDAMRRQRRVQLVG